jgi:hypothetical protein
MAGPTRFATNLHRAQLRKGWRARRPDLALLPTTHGNGIRTSVEKYCASVVLQEGQRPQLLRTLRTIEEMSLKLFGLRYG